MRPPPAVAKPKPPPPPIPITSTIPPPPTCMPGACDEPKVSEKEKAEAQPPSRIKSVTFSDELVAQCPTSEQDVQGGQEKRHPEPTCTRQELEVGRRVIAKWDGRAWHKATIVAFIPFDKYIVDWYGWPGHSSMISIDDIKK